MEKEKNAFHFIGIGGIGMSALARILLEKKCLISGSDLFSTANIEDLVQKGAKVKVGHSAENIPSHATVVYSSDIKKSNPEFQAAQGLQCKMIHRSELLASLMHQYKTLTVTGTHGKTTTTSLLACTLQQAGMDPTFAIGGMVNGINGKLGHSEYFVAEADESDGSFLKYHSYGAIVTNIEPEHMENYGSEKALHEAFFTFIKQIQNPAFFFFCGDDPVLNASCQGKGISYGFSKTCQLHITHFQQKGWRIFFDIVFEGKTYKEIEASLIGHHNALNAAAVFGLSLKLGASEEAIREAFRNFQGIARRCQKRAEVREVLLLDDYAHHPTEVKKTLEAIRDAVQERRLIAIFQPHRFTRLKDHLEAFAKSFDCVDMLFITDIYSAREEPIPGITVDKLLQEIKKCSTVPASYVSQEKLLSCLQHTVRPHDVVVTLGAGDITYFHRDFHAALLDQPPKKIVVGLVFGGRSCEHEISLRSSRFVNASLNKELYEVKHFGIDKQGNWMTGEEASTELQNATVLSEKNTHPLLSSEITKELMQCDLFFPVLHGPFGEDGTLQGFFELLGKPYAGPGYRGAAICMDKVLTKKLISEAGVPTPPYVAFGVWEWQRCEEELLEKVKKLSFPVFVKPSHAGSSVGITKVDDFQNVSEAVEYAFRFDNLILVEQGVVGCRELEFAVMGNHLGAIAVPPPGEKLAGGEFVDYEKKYGKNSVKTDIQASLPDDLLKKGQKYARMAYEATGNSGMTRVDFLLDDKGEFWFFEMNPIPGLQPLSLFPKIWNKEGFPGDKLVDRLIILGLERCREQNRHLNPL